MKSSSFFIPIFIIFFFASCSEKGSENYERAEAFRVTGEFVKAINEYKLAIELNPTQSKYYYGLAEVYEMQDSLENAVKRYEQAYKLAPDSSRYISKYNFIQGKILFDNNDFMNSLSYLIKSKVATKDSLINIIKGNLINEAKKSFIRKDYNKSEQILMHLIHFGLYDENLYYDLSKVYLQKGQKEKRVEYLKKAILKNPNKESYHYELGRYYFGNLNYDLAIKEFENCIPFKDSNYFLKLSKTKHSQQLSREADKYYFTAKKYFNKSDHYLSDWTDAKTNIDKAISILPNKNTYQNLRSRLQKERLLFPEGNSLVRMSVKDLGIHTDSYSYENKRSIYIWLENISNNTFHSNPNYFTMVGVDGYSYHYEGGSFPAVDLQPGTKTSGSLYFPTVSKPKKIIFENFQAGKIERVFSN